MSREDQFVQVANTLIADLLRLLPRVAKDSVAKERFVDITDTLGRLSEDFFLPRKPYVEIMIPNPKMVEHAFEEVNA